jgi:hypothetical protein
VPVYGKYGTRLQEVWCPFTVSMVPIYGKLWCPFTVSNRMVPVYGKLWCPFTVSNRMVPVYGKLWCPFTVSMVPAYRKYGAHLRYV